MNAAPRPSPEQMPRGRRNPKTDRRAGQWAEQLPPETTVDFTAERAASGIDDILAALDG